VSQSSPARSRDGGCAQGVHAAASLTLLDAFELACDGAPVAIPMSAQRLLAFLALHPRPLLRPLVAGTLWPETTEERAHASLRSALWRLHRLGDGLVDVTGPRLRLGAAVEVDLRLAEATARRLLEGAEAVTAETATLFGELLPDWYEDWVLLERERFRQLRLRALDALCERLTRADRLAEAFEIGLAALAAEPLRESAHRALVRIHLAEGNAGEALRQYRLCRRLLGERLGIEPSAQMDVLVAGVAPSR
jgi:DNA-binding SARP family transcriptional activator